jgi:hypothetical protein
MGETRTESVPAPKPAAIFLGKLKTGTEKMQRDLKREIGLAKARLCRPDHAHKAAGAVKPKTTSALLRKFPDLDKLRRP